MIPLMSARDAQDLLRDLAYANKHNFSNKDKTIESLLIHSYSTGFFAQELAHSLGLHPQEAFLAGLFHDVGRWFLPALDRPDQPFHEIIGARYLEEEGVKLGLGAQSSCSRLAQMIRSHFVVYEQFNLPEIYGEFIEKLNIEKIDSQSLLPLSLNEKIIVYADLTNYLGSWANFNCRLAKLKEYELKRKQNKLSSRLKAIEKAEPRLLEIKKEIEEALDTEGSKKSCVLLQLLPLRKQVEE